jgi:hypothetical protein
MPHPRAPRPTRPCDEDPVELARLKTELRARLDKLRWTIDCNREHWRRVAAMSPPRGPWHAVAGLAAEISRDRIKAGERPPPNLPPGWTP